jgi:hypothetical protein
MDQTQVRLVHWYDTATHRNACGAPGHSGSTKHAAGVTCSACRALLAELRAVTRMRSDPVSLVH